MDGLVAFLLLLLCLCHLCRSVYIANAAALMICPQFSSSHFFFFLPAAKPAGHRTESVVLVVVVVGGGDTFDLDP